MFNRIMFDQSTLRRIRLTALSLAIVIGASGLAHAQDWRYNDHDRDDDWRYNDHDRENYRYDRDDDRRGSDVARDIGFHDGTYMARQDMYRRKPETHIRGASMNMQTTAIVTNTEINILTKQNTPALIGQATKELIARR
jgi:hypothetical protein